MRKIFILTMSLLCICATTGAAKGLFKKNKKKSKQATEAAAPPADPKKTEYDKLIKDMTCRKGMFVTYYKEGRLLWELDSDMFGHDYLLVTRVSESSMNTVVGVAGQVVRDPLCFRLSTDSVNVYLHEKQVISEVEKGDAIESSFRKNYADPIVMGFKIKSNYGGKTVIDVTDFFTGDSRIITPVNDGVRKSYALAQDASLIREVKTFPTNVEVCTQMTYRNGQSGQGITLVAHRSIVQLPDTLMERRLQDNRVGYFHSPHNLYDTKHDKVTTYNVIHRWRVEPKPEDREAYFRGQLVEPAKPIVFYVDTAFPQKWRDTILQGILDWNQAFEAAGFKNVIQAKMYPDDDPEFDPDDMRYNCVKYGTIPFANAMGPSYVDPRTGEILNAEVIWYHNVLKLVHDWRFVQTGAVDPRVRTNVFPDDVMCESLRYVISHEIGHTLGLLHNMGASYSIPVESLRDPAFTQKHGTTPSIMDYARNNFVAQPGDLEKGVRLTPPVLGVYDIYAINWGYRLIDGHLTPHEQVKTLSAWIEEKKGDPMYKFGLQQVGDIEDPTAQTEDLSNDPIKSSDYSISNLKIIAANFEQWLGVKGDTYADLKETFQEIANQYIRHLNHVLPYIGGVVYTYDRVGDKDGVRVFIPRRQQKESLQWLVEQLKGMNSWLMTPERMVRMGFNLNISDGLMKGFVAAFYQPQRLQRIYEGGVIDPSANYTLTAYLDDVYTTLFRPTLDNKALSEAEMKMQASAIESLLTGMGALQPKMSFGFGFADSEEFPCCFQHAHAHEHETQSAVMRTPSIPPVNAVVLKSMSYGQLQKITRLYQSRLSAADKASRDFYHSQLQFIESTLKK